MKKFRCTVTRIDEYDIEMDELVLNEKWMADFRKTFYYFHTLKEHAEQLAQMKARFGDSFIEGYGTVLIDGEEDFRYKDEYESNRAINMKVISEDEDCEVEVEEI